MRRPLIQHLLRLFRFIGDGRILVVRELAHRLAQRFGGQLRIVSVHFGGRPQPVEHRLDHCCLVRTLVAILLSKAKHVTQLILVEHFHQ